ncbi:MAG: methyltransferase domain-containing protein [Dehalococcoidia bacterium]|nr:methyltransferase domain-containing protein [Dehalococcoidia bacterium]
MVRLGVRGAEADREVEVTNATSGAWDPAQYQRFANERSQPFYDLAAMVQRRPGMRVVDLGCGAGDLTAWLHGALEASETLGLDADAAMLAQAEAHAGNGVRFEAADIRAWTPDRPYDLVFSNAALQWVDGHEELWPRLASWVAPGGQVAIQMPMNDGHPSHATARALAAEEPYASVLGAEGYGGAGGRFPTLPPERYAEILHALGFERPRVHLEVYGHVLPETRSVVEWIKGSALTPYRDRLSPELYARFLEEYTRRLVARLGEHAPFFYTFKRVLMWGRYAG